MSLFQTLNTGLTGLTTAGAGLETTTHNVANATTAGYTRKRLVTSVSDPVRRGLVWLGQGARIDHVARTSDPFAFGRLVATAGNASSAATEHAALVAFEGLFEPSLGTSLRQSVDGLFSAFTAATADPSDLGLRRNVVGAASTFTHTVNGIAQGLEVGIADREAAMGGSVASINADLKEVAALNEALLSAGGALSAGDLADRRDAAIGRLADAIGATAHVERDGTVTVRVGTHAAVSGGAAREVGVTLTTGARPEVTLSVDDAQVRVTNEIGGAIGGELTARNTLSGWLSDLDTLVSDLATTINGQLGAGFDRSGGAGGPLFTLPISGSIAAGVGVDAAVSADPGLLAFGSGSGFAGDGGNLALLIDIEGQAIVGGLSAGAFATNLTGRVGSDTSLAGIRASAAYAANDDAVALHSTLSGVDLDEEAVRLVEYQAAYQAAAKVISVTDEMLDALMRIAG